MQILFNKELAKIVNEEKFNSFQTESSTTYKIAIRRHKPIFKKQNWLSKFRSKEKNSRVTKNIKSLIQEPLDSLSFNLCIEIIYFIRPKH